MFDLLSDIFSALKVLLIVAVVIGIISGLRFVFRFLAKRMPLVIAMAFFGAKTRADAWDLIADMMESGKDDRRSIEAVAESFESDGKYAAAISLRELAKSFQIGKFTQSVRKVARGSESLVFSNAGKTSGPVVFRGAARILRNEAAIKRAVIQGLAQPTLLTFGMIGLLLIFGLKLFPAFEEIAPKSTWPGVSVLIADAADMVISSGVAGAVIMGVLLLLVVISVPLLNSVEDGFIRSLRNALDFYPPWVFYRLSTGASFAFAIVEIARSGGTLNGATLTNMAKHGSRYSRLNIQRIATALSSGASLSVAVRHAGSWPDPNLNSTLALLANEANALEKFGAYVDRWMVRAEQNVKAKSAVLNKILIFMIAGMALACVMSIFGVISSFGTSSGL